MLAPTSSRNWSATADRLGEFVVARYASHNPGTCAGIAAGVFVPVAPTVERDCSDVEGLGVEPGDAWCGLGAPITAWAKRCSGDGNDPV